MSLVCDVYRGVKFLINEMVDCRAAMFAACYGIKDGSMPSLPK
jgi:hypothetical protein